MSDDIQSKSPSNKTSMADRIMAVIGNLHSGVSFVELKRSVEGFEGTFEMHLQKNCVLWSGMSMEAVDALYDLRDAEKLHFWPTSQLVYLLDGVMLSYPAAKRAPPKGGYKKPHWLPVCINSGPPPAKYRRKAP